MASRSTPAPGGNVIEFADARQRRAAAAPPPPPAAAVADADDCTVLQLTDALVLLFHLRANGQSPATCRELEQAVRIAVAARPMAETVDIGDDAWDVISAVDLRHAIASCRLRFDADWSHD